MKQIRRDPVSPFPFLMVAGVIVEGITKPVVNKAVKDGADAFELRIDTFSDRNNIEALVKGVERIKVDSRTLHMPLIVTVRSKREGGRFSLSDKKREEIFTALLPYADYIDIELSSAARFTGLVRTAKRKKKRVILSYHNFNSTPGRARLKRLIEKGRERGGDIVKIATSANSTGDLLRLAGALVEHKKLIVVAMGRFGKPSRVFFPLLGSLITYGSITEKSAPGQLPVKTIKREFGLYGF